MTGPTSRNRLETIRPHLRLDGEAVCRTDTGKPVTPDPNRKGYAQVRVGNTVMTFHRVKFALAHGWLPTTVDHKNRDIKDDRLENLRAATYQEQNRNRSRHGGLRKSSLPRGVTKRPNGRFSANVTVDRKARYLGDHDTPGEASAAVEDRLREVHGEFYKDHR